MRFFFSSLASILFTFPISVIGATAQQQTVEPSMFMASLRVLWGLLVVLAIILAAYVIIKKRFSFLPGGDKGIIQIVEVKHLMPKKAIYLLNVRGNEYLVGVAENQINLITNISTNKMDIDFQSVLDQSVSKDNL